MSWGNLSIKLVLEDIYYLSVEHMTHIDTHQIYFCSLRSFCLRKLEGDIIASPLTLSLRVYTSHADNTRILESIKSDTHLEASALVVGDIPMRSLILGGSAPQYQKIIKDN